MRPPSPRVLANTADVYSFGAAGAMDADGSVVADDAYPSTPTYAAEPCRYCPEYAERIENEQGRVSQYNSGLLIFARDLGLKINDRVVVAGKAYFVDGQADMATAGSAWGVKLRSIP